jgi:hypothetical protein
MRGLSGGRYEIFFRAVLKSHRHCPILFLSLRLAEANRFSQAKLGEARVVVGTAAQGPAIFPLGF